MTFSINHHRRPQLADIQCSRLKFEPGQRVLVKMFTEWPADKKRKVRKSIEKFAGVAVEVLFYNATEMEIYVEQASHRGTKIVLP